jgi:hypothetical protein
MYDMKSIKQRDWKGGGGGVKKGRKGTNQDKEKKNKMYVGETEIKRLVKETVGDLLS